MEEIKFPEIREDKDYIRPVEVWLDLTLTDLIQRVEVLFKAMQDKDENKVSIIITNISAYLTGLRDGNRFNKNPYKIN